MLRKEWKCDKCGIELKRENAYRLKLERFNPKSHGYGMFEKKKSWDLCKRCYASIHFYLKKAV